VWNRLDTKQVANLPYLIWQTFPCLWSNPMNRLTKSFVALAFALGTCPASVQAGDVGSDDKILDSVHKSLKESGVTEKTSRQILAKLKERLNETESTVSGDDEQATEDVQKDSTQRDDSLGDVRFFDKDGKEQRIELKRRMPPIFFDGRRFDETEWRESMEQMQKAMQENRQQMQRNTSEYAIGILLMPPDESNDEAAASSSHEGIAVKSVFDDTPASEAGLEPGDKLKTIDGKKIVEAAQVQEIVQKAGKANMKITLRWERDGETMEAELKPQKVPATQELYGMRMGDPGFRFDPPRVYVAPNNPMAFPGFDFNHDQLRKEVGELKEQLNAMRSDLQEIKELLSKAGEKGE
jgi:hypothetical protein